MIHSYIHKLKFNLQFSHWLRRELKFLIHTWETTKHESCVLPWKRKSKNNPLKLTMLTLLFNCCNFPAAFKDFRCIVHGFIEIYIVIRTYACLVQLFGIQTAKGRLPVVRYPHPAGPFHTQWVESLCSILSMLK